MQGSQYVQQQLQKLTKQQLRVRRCLKPSNEAETAYQLQFSWVIFKASAEPRRFSKLASHWSLVICTGAPAATAASAAAASEAAVPGCATSDELLEMRRHSIFTGVRLRQTRANQAVPKPTPLQVQWTGVRSDQGTWPAGAEAAISERSAHGPQQRLSSSSLQLPGPSCPRNQTTYSSWARD